MFFEQLIKAQGIAITELELTAFEYANKNKSLCLDDLGVVAKRKIALIAAAGNQICASCRYQSGCLRCDRWKAERYYLRKLALEKGVPMPEKW